MRQIFTEEINWKSTSNLRNFQELQRCLALAINRQQEKQDSKKKADKHIAQYQTEHHFHDLAIALGCNHLLIEKRTIQGNIEERIINILSIHNAPMKPTDLQGILRDAGVPAAKGRLAVIKLAEAEIIRIRPDRKIVLRYRKGPL